MFKPRHAYRSPVTFRYRGKAKGCPVFNNLAEISSEMVEQHDECLECLAKLKNRTELYKTLADNNKPSNNVIKSLQRLSSSASNNRLKTCLQFLIIKVNEKSIIPNSQPITGSDATSPKYFANAIKDASSDNNSNQVTGATSLTQVTRHSTKRQKSYHNQTIKQQNHEQHLKHKHNPLASPPQDQVSSTQDQVCDNVQDDQDCQASPSVLTTTQHMDEPPVANIETSELFSAEADVSLIIKNEEQQTDYIVAQTTTATNKSSPDNIEHKNALPTNTSTTNTTTISTSPPHQEYLDMLESEIKLETDNSDTKVGCGKETGSLNCNQQLSTKFISKYSPTSDSNHRESPAAKRKRTQNSLSSDQETSSVTSWSLTSCGITSPPSPASSTSSISSSYSSSTSSICSSSSCSSSPHHDQLLSPSPYSTPDIISEIKGPRLKLSEEKIRKIKKRPVLLDDLYYFTEQQSSLASTPTTSSGCSPGQQSSTTQVSDQSTTSVRNYKLSSGNNVMHMFQAPPSFVNSLKPCNLPTKSHEQSQMNVQSVVSKAEMINCAICGIKDKPPNISKVFGQNSCLLCTKFFSTFLKRPQQLYCAQDGDCLMTFDSRCQACWIKICLQKFDIDEEHRKTGWKYSPKLLSSPKVSLITIDTSLIN